MGVRFSHVHATVLLLYTCPDFECDLAVGVDAVEGGDRLRVTVLEAASSIRFSFTTFMGDSLRDEASKWLHQ